MSHTLQKHNVLEELCYIALAENMASTVKLQALRALDSLLEYPQGLERFLGWSTRTSTSSSLSFGSQPISPYQQILSLVLSQPVCCFPLPTDPKPHAQSTCTSPLTSRP